MGLTLLHLGDQLLVEQASGLLVQRAVDGNHITLSQHLLQIHDTTAANLLLDLGLEGLVVEVQKLLAVEWLETSQDTLTDTSHGNGTDDLALEIELVLGRSSDVPLTILDLFVCGDEVADEDEDGHDHVLCDGDDVRAGDFCNGDAAIGRVRSVEVDVIGTDTSSDSKLELLGLCETLGGQVPGVETVCVSIYCSIEQNDLRCGDDNFSVNELLVELGVLALLVGGGDQCVSLILEPFADAELVLSCA
jgi:hypothetical protein